MSSVVLDAGAAQSQVPAVYAETLVCGGGGVVAGTDPAVGVKFSRQYGPLGLQTELMAAVRKDIGLAPVANVAGGTLDCAGITFQGSVIADGTLNAGNSVMGIAQLTSGVAVVNAAAVSYVSPSQRSVILVTRSPGGGAAANTGPLSVGFNTGSAFTVTGLNSLDGTTNTADNGYFFWVILNPNWSA